MTRLRIKNLSGAFTSEGLAQKSGRHPTPEDCGFVKGPLDILVDTETGKILSLGEASSGVERELDARGLVATPGFVDSHTHALFTGTRAREYFMRWAGKSYREISDQGGGIHNTFQAIRKTPDDVLLGDLYDRLNLMRQKGTLCVEIKSGYGGTPEDELRCLRLIDRAKKDPLCPVRIRSSFLALHALPKDISETHYVDQMIAVLPVVAQEGLADYVDAFPEQGFFSLSESLRFLGAALKLGLKSKVHADELTPMACVEGVVPLKSLSVDHLQKISQAGIEALKNSSTVATFLPSTSFYLDLEYAPARRVIDAGARVALASDYNPGTSPEAGLQLTALLAASRMKLSAAEIFAGLTLNAAASLGLETSTGRIAPGFDADLNFWKLRSTVSSSTTGQELLEEIFVDSLTPVLTLRGGR
jgi:imidazolonepropionase